MNKDYDFLIVGAGLFGSTFAYLANKAGKRCLMIDKRSHVGGNVFCEDIEGINVHKYGAHIFHTSDKEVWDFVNSIVPFNRYTNSPIAVAPDCKLYNLPFNMNTFYQLWGVRTPDEARSIIDRQRRESMEQLKAMGADQPRNLEEQALLLIGRDIYEKLIKGYTEKQWGRRCSELPADIIRRLPVRMSFDNNYFNDTFQGIPIGGYNKLINGLLAGSEVVLNRDYLKNGGEFNALADRIVFTGPIDAYFGYRFGHLQWRTVRFDTQIVDTPNWQGNAVVNYTSKEVPFTRIIEHKHFESFGDAVYANPRSVISKEYSSEWEPGIEPYYPINDERNNTLYLKYKELADKEQNVIFGGRLAEYKYYDMGPIIRQVLNLFK